MKTFGEFLIRTVGFLAAVAAIGLTVGVVWKFTGGQDHIAIGVALLSVLISSVGLLMARSAWRKAAYVECVLGIAMWVAGAAFLGFNELGYWATNYETRHAAYQREKTAELRREGLKDRAWQALTTGEAPPSPAVLEARINAAKQHERWLPSKGCTEATVRESQEFCKGYFDLQAQLAQAIQHKAFETEVLTATQGKAVTSGIAGMNVFANAEWLARKFGGTERQWADYILLTGLAVLMLVRDMGFLVAFPLGKRREPAPDLKAVDEAEPEDDPGKSEPVPYEPQEEPQVFALRKTIVVQEPFKVREDPHRKIAFSIGTRPQLAFTNEDEEKPAEEPVKPPLPAKESNRVKKAKAQNKKHKLSRQVLDWLCEATSSEPGYSVPSGRCFDNYKTWCLHNGQPEHVGFRVFTGIVKEELGLDGAKRNNGGQTMLPIKLSDPKQWSGFAQQRRKAA